MSPAQHPYRAGCPVGPHVPAASALVWAWPLAGVLLPSRLMMIHPRSALRVIAEHPWGLLRAAAKGEAGTHHKEAGRVCRWVAPLWLTPAVPTPPLSASEDCLWGDQQEVQTQSSHAPSLFPLA